MKNTRILGLGLSLVLSLSACDNNSKNANSNPEEEKQNKVEKQEKVSPSKENQVSLNDGEKWKVNPEMKPHLEAAEKRLIAYRDNTETDYETLAEELKGYNDLLISSCTMGGKSHDQLHLWLHPHIKLVKALSEAKNEKEADSIIAELETSFETYHKYFN
jgi:type IV secretory pathway VirB10-like protein